MKLIFFILAFCLVSILYYFSWSGKNRLSRGISESNMVVKSDNFYEKIKYYGSFRLSEDETHFKSISPGGYFKFQLNDKNLTAESNLQGEIEYTINGSKNNLLLNAADQQLTTLAVNEMIHWGYDADARMERIYQKGGVSLLLSETDSMKTDQLRILYLNRLFSIDTLSSECFVLATRKISSMGSDMNKAGFLTKITSAQLKNPQVDSAYFEIIKDMHSDMDKSNALKHIIAQDSAGNAYSGKILSAAASFGSDMDRANIYNELIDKGMIRDSLVDTLLVMINQMGSDMDKANLYRNLSKLPDLETGQWISLIRNTGEMGSDMDKSNLLTEMASRMPKTDSVKTAYLKVARSLGNDMDYGKVVRAVE